MSPVITSHAVPVNAVSAVGHAAAGDQDSTVGPARVRVASFNVRHGTDAAGVDRLDDQADLLAALGVDVVLLQELDCGLPRSGCCDQLRQLARRAGFGWAVAGPNLALGSGWYGIGIASRWPLRDTRHTNVPLAHWPGSRLGLDGRHHRPESRGVLVTRVFTPWGPLAVGTTHASMHPQERLAGAQLLTRHLTEVADGAPMVAGGDLNADRELSTDILEMFGSDVAVACGQTHVTFPQTGCRLDRLYTAGNATAVQVGVTDRGVSDHALIWADVTWPTGCAAAETSGQ